MKILYTTQEIRGAISDLFEHGTARRVAIAAFVGHDAESFLPKAKGIEVYCWPIEGVTHPLALETLKTKRANIFFSDSMHMKLYWAEDQGCVLSSANLSKNALGSGNLKEIGVLLDSQLVDIERIIKGLNARPMAAQELKSLGIRHRKALQAGRPAPLIKRSFGDWMKEPTGESLLFGWYERPIGAARIAKKVTQLSYGHDPLDWMYIKKDQALSGQYFVAFHCEEQSIKEVNWMYIDHVRKVERGDPTFMKSFPYIAFQNNKSDAYRFPFTMDSKFRSAFKKAALKRGISSIVKSKDLSIGRDFLKEVKKYYDQQKR